MILEDGSRLYVNTDSALRVAYSATSRSVELAQGEVFFEVKPDQNRPFIVRAGDYEVRVVGTKFNVLRDGKGVNVAVVEGRVRVITNAGSPTPKTIELVSGQRVVVERAKAEPLLHVTDSRASQPPSWTAGQLEFREASLADVIYEVNRYIPKPYFIADPRLNDIKLSGRFRTGDDETVRFALRERFGIRAVDEGSRVALHLR
jgi:transmembrane sensor